MTVEKLRNAGDIPAGAKTPVVLAAYAQPLSREQTRFNTLIARIAAARLELAQWQELMGEMRSFHAAQIVPIERGIRQKRFALLALYEQTMAGGLLNERERLKLADIICALVRQLMQDGSTPELVRLYDKYSEISHADAQALETEQLIEMAGEIFGVKLDKHDLGGSGRDTAERIAQKVAAAGAARTARREARAQKKKQKNPEAAGREEQRAAAREQAAQHATQSIREVYRKLASELHPDREPDAVERERKTVLMQKVNKAYADGDLLTLLELQLEIEQINPAALAGMARERLVRLNAVLTEQLQRLREALEETIAPLVATPGPRAPYAQNQVTPQAIRQSLNREAAVLQAGLAAINADLYDHADVRELKRALKRYRIGTFEPATRDAMAGLQEITAMAQSGTRRQGRRR